jgi:hypothetical protein
MTASCSKLHFVQQGKTCDITAALYSISTAQSQGGHLLLRRRHPHADSNGISTPLPRQTGMVTDYQYMHAYACGEVEVRTKSRPQPDQIGRFPFRPHPPSSSVLHIRRSGYPPTMQQSLT